MKIKVVKDNKSERYIASTDHYIGTFYGYGITKESAIEDLKQEVEFAVRGGYTKNTPTQTKGE
jgi:hypothetical protein